MFMKNSCLNVVICYKCYLLMSIPIFIIIVTIFNILPSQPNVHVTIKAFKNNLIYATVS